MISNFSANAILAKARAMHGQRLKNKDYQELLSCKTVGEAATYLKNKTSFHEVFEGVITSSMHRGQVESILRKRLFLQYASLCRYEMAIGHEFYKYFLISNDIEQILTCVRLLNAGRSEDYLFSMPVSFDELTALDLYKLAEVRSYKDLLDALEGTDYKKVLSNISTKYTDYWGILNIEAALFRYKYLELKAIAQKRSKGKRRQEILDFLKLQCDTQTIITLYRLKRLFPQERSRLWQHILIEMSNLTEKQWRLLIDAEDSSALLKIVKKTFYGKGISPEDIDFVEESAQVFLYERTIKLLRFSDNPTIVMFCYIFLAENEISNITHIIEGIRYGLSSSETKSLLVGIED